MINLKLKSAQFKTISRRKTIVSPTDKAHEIFDVASQLLQKELASHLKWRLLGVGVDGFQSGAQTGDFLTMMDETGQRKDKLERALDDMHAKFGGDVVFSGRQMKQKD